MRRRSFMASGLGLMAAAATQGIMGTIQKEGVQPTVALAAQGDPAGPPQGKWIKLAPLPKATDELLGAAVNGKLYAS